MIQPGRYDMGADRWVACIRTFTFVDLDLTGASFASHIRLEKDNVGAPLVNLGDAASGAAEGVRIIAVTTATVQAHIDAGRIDEAPPGYALTDTIVVSEVGLRINETTMEGLPYPGERGDDAFLAWDLHITPSGGVKDKYLGGDFVVRAGATQ